MENKNHRHKMKGGKKTNTELYVQLAIIGVLAVVVIFSIGKIYGAGGTAAGIGTVSASEIIPTGVPAVYGEELQISYDDVSPSNPGLADATIRKLEGYEDKQLNSEQMQRYIKIAGSISCEYCCGAQSLIFSSGERACGCAHSYAMRGLAKYLIIEHGSEFTDEEILSELGKWKVLFFPEIHEQKATVLKEQGIELNYINLASNMYRGIEKGQTSGGSMVGGC